MPINLSEGDRAPSFTLPTDGDGSISLKEKKGKKVVIFFYPKDDTSGCTKEAIAFTELLPKFKRAGADVIGISKDSPVKHAKFREKHNLKVILGSDETCETIAKYGVWVEKSMYGRKYMGTERSTFLIDEKGKIHKIWRKVKVAEHAEDVLEAVKAI